ncbi:insulin-like peptide INSL5 [Aythya fuligula]|uniref:Insulin-like peptide INSL5 n=1 Tax=Aythya fuligula TaxID=219594 RepID=A0A6J3DBE7_AYTFU|nr:insulin-like peptide INSL5 [Aythya fuligula]
MRSTLLALAALALLAVARQAHGEGSAVKLCGRDFVRAIVFTCGGSRWRRDLADYQYLFGESSENPPPSSENGYADPLTYTDRRLGTDSEEILNTKPETKRAVQHPRKMSMLRKREVAKLLTTSCCSVGCSERDISSLC